jgi:hypothetical protein
VESKQWLTRGWRMTVANRTNPDRFFTEISGFKEFLKALENTWQTTWRKS